MPLVPLRSRFDHFVNMCAEAIDVALTFLAETGDFGA
jgi:hypothetical protein